MRRDLFDDSPTDYAQHAALLYWMVADKLAELVESVCAEGWSWVEARTSIGQADFRDFRRIAEEEIELPEEKAELVLPTTEQGKLLDAQYDEVNPNITSCIDAIQAHDRR